MLLSWAIIKFTNTYTHKCSEKKLSTSKYTSPLLKNQTVAGHVTDSKHVSEEWIHCPPLTVSKNISLTWATFAAA